MARPLLRRLRDGCPANRDAVAFTARLLMLSNKHVSGWRHAALLGAGEDGGADQEALQRPNVTVTLVRETEGVTCLSRSATDTRARRWGALRKRVRRPRRSSFTTSCQSAFKRDPFLGVIGVEQGPPCGAGIWAARPSGMSGVCQVCDVGRAQPDRRRKPDKIVVSVPAGRHRRGCQRRFLKRQLSLPVSTMSQ